MVFLQSPQSETLICSQTQAAISLQSLVASGGEGTIWRTHQPGLLAKIYYAPNREQARKLAVMVANPPRDPNAHIGHISYAWPRSLLQNTQGDVVGFLMSEIPHSVELIDVYHPARRQKILPDFSWLYLHVTAVNVASLIWAIHHAGYVLGDIKPQNILVNSEGLPGLIDTDSFQVRDPNSNELFRCLVGSESFTPPELLGQDLAWVEQTSLQDRFRLGVILYLLLFGEHPFKGQWMGDGDSPSPNDLVRWGFWPYSPMSPIQPSRLTVPMKVVHPELQRCFVRCFTDGHRNPDQRPSAPEWVKAFKIAIADLKSCPQVKRHIYSLSYGHCHWCDRAEQLGVDVFPAPESQVQRALTTLQKQVQSSIPKKSVPKKQTPTPATGHQHSTPQKIITYASTVASLAQGVSPKNINAAMPSPAASISFMQKRSVQVGAVLLLSGLLTLLIGLASVDSETFGLTMVGLVLCLLLVALCFGLNRISQ